MKYKIKFKANDNVDTSKYEVEEWMEMNQYSIITGGYPVIKYTRNKSMGSMVYSLIVDYNKKTIVKEKFSQATNRRIFEAPYKDIAEDFRVMGFRSVDMQGRTERELIKYITDYVMNKLGYDEAYVDRQPNLYFVKNNNKTHYHDLLTFQMGFRYVTKEGGEFDWQEKTEHKIMRETLEKFTPEELQLIDKLGFEIEVRHGKLHKQDLGDWF